MIALSRVTPPVLSPSMPRARAEEELVFFEDMVKAKRLQLACAVASEDAAGDSSARSGAVVGSAGGDADAAEGGGDATQSSSASSASPAHRPVGPRAEELVSAVGFKPNVLANSRTPKGVTAPQFLEFHDRPKSEWPKDWFLDKSFQSVSSGGRPLFPSQNAKDVMRLNAMRKWHLEHVEELRQLGLKTSRMSLAEKERMAWLETTGTSKRQAVLWAGKPRGITACLRCVLNVLFMIVRVAVL